MENTKFKNNQILRIRKGFNRGVLVKAIDHKIVNDTNTYKCIFLDVSKTQQLKETNKFEWIEEQYLIQTIRLMGKLL